MNIISLKSVYGSELELLDFNRADGYTERMRVLKILGGLALTIAGLLMMLLLVVMVIQEPEWTDVETQLGLIVILALTPVSCGVWLFRAGLAKPVLVVDTMPQKRRSALEVLKDQFVYETTMQIEDLPERLDGKGFCFAAFLLPLPWLVVHRYYFWSAFILIFIFAVGWFFPDLDANFGTGLSAAVGIVGHKLAWKSRRYADMEQYRRTQNHWVFWGFVVFVVVIAYAVLMLSQTTG